jgi:HK97 family phage major capsid protein
LKEGFIMNIKEMLDQRSYLVLHTRELLNKADKEKRSMSNSEQSEYDSNLVKIEELSLEIERQNEVLFKEAGVTQNVDLNSLKPGTGNGRYAITTDGKSIRMLSNTEKLASSCPVEENQWGVADFVRANLGIKEKRDTVISSPATVGLLISGQIIDDVRAKARIIQAGALTIPVQGDTNLARIDGDPTVFEHAEGVDDINESTPVLSPVELKPQTLAAIIPVSLELASDSKNFDAALRTAITSAFASKLDTLGIATILANGSIPTSAFGEDCATWAGTMAAVTSALTANQDIPSALIASEIDYGARASELAVDGGMWLGPPPVLRNMLDLPTTSMEEGTAIFGNYSRGVAVAVRQDLGLEMVRWGKPTSGSHILIAVMRAQIFVLQPKALYIQKQVIES